MLGEANCFRKAFVPSNQIETNVPQNNLHNLQRLVWCWNQHKIAIQMTNNLRMQLEAGNR